MCFPANGAPPTEPRQRSPVPPRKFKVFKKIIIIIKKNCIYIYIYQLALTQYYINFESPYSYTRLYKSKSVLLKQTT